MSLKDISNDLRRGPTSLHPKEELAIIHRVMQIPVEQILRDKEDFMAVMDDLYTSHIDAVFEITDDTLLQFKVFADWLDALANNLQSQGMRDLAHSMAEHFRIDSKDIET